MEYIYCDEVHLTAEVAVELVQIADKYRIPVLKTACEKFLKDCFTAENAIDIAIMANKIEAKELEENAVKYIALNLKMIFEKSDPTRLPKSVLYQVFMKNQDFNNSK